MKKIINSLNAPAPIGPYSQSVIANRFLFVSGQIPLDPTNGELITGSISEETLQVMKNLEAILLEANTKIILKFKFVFFLGRGTYISICIFKALASTLLSPLI